MNVKVEVELICPPKAKHREQMYDASENLTDDKSGILISIPSSKLKTVVAEFTIKKARQIDVVDKIGREFSYCLTDYNNFSISFPAPKKKSMRGKSSLKKEKEKTTFTEKQGQYLAFIHKFIKSKGHSPSVSDFGQHFCVGSTSVYRILSKLEEKGLIKRNSQKSLSIDLLVSEDKLPDLKGCVLGRKKYDKLFHLF